MNKISVIIPVYNEENHLSRCVESVRSQTYRNLEIILVNDGSTDDSGRICDDFKKQDDRIKVIHKKNGGLSSARNKGIDIATGKYITFVDSDDWIQDDIYEHCIDLFESEKCDVVDFECVMTKDEISKSTDKSYKINSVIGKKEILRDYLYRGQTKKAPFTVWRKVYKRNLFDEVRFPEGKINEDIATNYKLLMKCHKITYTTKIGYYYFQENTSLTRGGLKERDFDLLDASKELISLTKNEEYKDIKYLAKVKLARSYFSLLAKIAFYGIEDKNIDQKKVKSDLTKKLRHNFPLLIKSPIPISRKILITIMCMNLKLISYPISIYKKIVIRK